jgi:hypothetical protein
MTKKKHVLICFLVFLMFVLIVPGSFAAPSSKQRATSIIGVWYGVHRQQGSGTETQEICRFGADGSFDIRFRAVEKKGQPVLEQNEAGRWELKGNIKTMVTTHINGKHLGVSQYITDRYLITDLSDSEMRYEDITSKAQFKLIRAKEGFEFP